MAYRDVSNEIAEVAKGYHFTKPPAAVEDFLAWLANTIRTLLGWLRDLFSHNGGAMDSRGMSFLLQIAVYVVAVIAVCWLVYYLAKKAGTARSAQKRAIKGATVVEELLDADGWQHQAEKLASTADYKGACRALYLSVLQRFHENEIAQFAPTKTNYEYAYSLSKYPEIQSQFKSLAERVELIWFGNHTAGEDDFADSKGKVLEMDPEIRRIGAAKAQEKLTRV